VTVEPDDLAALAARLRERHGDLRAPPIGRLPARLGRHLLPRGSSPLQAVIGLDNEYLQPVALDLAESHALVGGPARSGLTTALTTIAAGLRDTTPDAELHVLAPRRSALASFGAWTSVASGIDACEAALERLVAELDGPAVVVVDDAMELAEGAVAMRMEALLRRGRDEQIRIVAAVEIHAALRAYGGWVRDLRAGRTGLLLQPNPDSDGELLGTRLSTRPGAVASPGRGFLVVRGDARVVQVAAP
jgi:S-DNA-T family DNA segregation ATPase FtsK/SpoIIIE